MNRVMSVAFMITLLLIGSSFVSAQEEPINNIVVSVSTEVDIDSLNDLFLVFHQVLGGKELEIRAIGHTEDSAEFLVNRVDNSPLNKDKIANLSLILNCQIFLNASVTPPGGQQI